MKQNNAVDAQGLPITARPVGPDSWHHFSPNSAAPAHTFLLIEDHPLYAEGFRAAISRLFPRALLETAVTAEAGRQFLTNGAYDLVFLDLNLPDMNGFELMQLLKQRQIWQPVVILTGLVDQFVIQRATRAGALGVLSKRVNDDEILQLCRRLLDGETIPELPARPIVAIPDDPNRLTRRELEVLHKLAEGMENSDIYTFLQISDSTLRTHMRALFQKLQVSNRTACVVKAIRLGLI